MRERRPKLLSPVKRFVAVRIVPWFILFLGAFGVYVGVEDILRAAATTQWPSVDGTVVRSGVASPDQASSGGTTKYRAEVIYEYTVDGTGLTGRRISAADFATNDRSMIQAILDRYPVGRIVTVHYQPDDPREAVLEPGLRALSFLIPAIGLATALIGFGLVLFAQKLWGESPAAGSRST